MSNGFFKQKAESYEQVSHRIANVENIAGSIFSRIQFELDMDFGSRTGLLSPTIHKSTSITG